MKNNAATLLARSAAVVLIIVPAVAGYFYATTAGISPAAPATKTPTPVLGFFPGTIDFGHLHAGESRTRRLFCRGNTIAVSNLPQDIHIRASERRRVLSIPALGPNDARDAASIDVELTNDVTADPQQETHLAELIFEIPESAPAKVNIVYRSVNR